MNPQSLERVSVWLEEGLPETAFPQALEWAFRLNLPLCAVVTSRPAGKNAPHENKDHRQTTIAQTINAWESACADRGVTLEIFLWRGEGDAGMKQFLRPRGLCVFTNVRSPTQEELLRRSIGTHENALLLARPICASITRILVLCDQQQPSVNYLEGAARVCQALEASPVILIVAKSERDGRMRQENAEGVSNSIRLRADIDLLVGCDMQSAVARVASWRGCSHLILQRRNTESLGRSGVDATLRPMCEFANSLNVLALHEAFVLDVPRKICNERASLLGKTGLPNARMHRKPVSHIEVYHE